MRSWSTKTWLGIVTLLVVSCIIFGCGRTRKSETTADNSEVESFAIEHSDKDVESESEETKSASRAFGMPPNAVESGSSPNPLFCNLSKQ